MTAARDLFFLTMAKISVGKAFDVPVRLEGKHSKKPNGERKGITHVKSLPVIIGRYNVSFSSMLPLKVASILATAYVSSGRLGRVR